jgi:hypothetical protein
MSKIRELWKQLEQETQLDLSTEYDELYGRFFSNGINIGREVRTKLKNGEQPWPTLLQFEGMDSGLTRGFLTSLDICVVEGQDHFSDLSTVVSQNYGFFLSFEKIDSVEQIEARYPGTDYQTYPGAQQWTLPGVVNSIILSNKYCNHPKLK